MIYINFCIDWEGDHFRNLSSLEQLLDQLGSDMPVTHFICPAYFHRFPQTAKQNILSVIRPADEVGLHVHCFKSLINKVDGVKFKASHNYYRQNDLLIQFRDWLLQYFPANTRAYVLHKLVSGRGVPLSVYTPKEIERILRYAKSLLQEQLTLEQVDSFRAGGWIASDEVLRALEKVNIPIDSSAVSPEIISQGYDKDFIGNHQDDFGESYPIFTTYLEKLWGRDIYSQGFLKNQQIHASLSLPYITKLSQPFNLSKTIEMPNNCGATDFASMERTFIPVFKQLLHEDVRKGGQKPLFMNITCHQEGDYYYKQGMLDFYQYVIKKHAHNVRFTTVKEAARIYRQSI